MPISRQPRSALFGLSVIGAAGLLILCGCSAGRRPRAASAPYMMGQAGDPAMQQLAAAPQPGVSPGPQVAAAPSPPHSQPPIAQPPIAQVAHHTLSDQEACYSGAAGPYGYAPIPAYIPNPQGIDGNEFLCDGADAPPSARARAGDQIIGVGLEDTVARYTTDRGDVHISPSNRVCVYAPRFGAVRRVTGAELGALAIGTQRLLYRDGPNRVEMEQPGLAVTGRNELVHSERTRGPDAVRARNRGVRVENVLQPELAEDVLALLSSLSIVNRGIFRESEKALLNLGSEAATIWSVNLEVAVVVAGEVAAAVTRDQAARELVIYELADAGRLRVCKLADRGDALPGEIVSFILRIDNVGESPLREIVLTDNLTTRLEYLPESQTSTMDAEFSAEANDGQSLRLTWKFAGELKVGEGATVQFKCRVR